VEKLIADKRLHLVASSNYCKKRSLHYISGKIAHLKLQISELGFCAAQQKSWF